MGGTRGDTMQARDKKAGGELVPRLLLANMLQPVEPALIGK
jgi:hypothetical protein